jgi:hypothetical protein
MYLTIDTAHQVGQRKYLKPETGEIMKAAAKGDTRGLWLGSAIQKKIAEGSVQPQEIESLLQDYAYLFSEEKDGELYEWAGELGCYSPVFHLQQTDGTYSGHKPFTAQYNEKGIVKPDKLLKAIARSYETEDTQLMPPKVQEIYLAFELFFGINERPEDIKRQIKESVEYWRAYIPEDGLPLDHLIEL